MTLCVCPVPQNRRRVASSCFCAYVRRFVVVPKEVVCFVSTLTLSDEAYAGTRATARSMDAGGKGRGG